jgi:hypothetical protein
MSIQDLLKAKYPAGEAVVCFEVPNGTGSNKSRSADAIAINLWPSRGLAIEGFEFKASRTDWLKELKDSSKADAFYRYCDFWWLIVTDKEIVKDGELPIGWGLMVAQKDRLKVLSRPKQNDKVVLDRDFVCGLLRAATSRDDLLFQRKINEARDKGYQEGQQSNTETEGRLIKKLEEKQTLIFQFEEASGLRLDGGKYARHSIKQIGDAVRDYLNGGITVDENKLLAIEQCASEITTALKRYKDLPKLKIAQGQN